MRSRPGLTAAAAASGVFALLPTAVLPLVIGAAIDDGIADGRLDTVLGWAAMVLSFAALQAVAGGVQAWTSHTMWIHGATRAQDALVGQVVRLGATLPKRVRTGDVVAIGSEDVYDIGNSLETVGRTAGSVISFLVIAASLVTIAPVLGAVALIGVPLAVLGIGPLLRPLRQRKEAQRERFSQVNALGTDIVAGLRILRGFGGERQFLGRFVAASQDVRDAGLRVGAVQSWLAAAEVVFPGLITVAVTWLGAHLAVAGEITPGELVAFYGASAFLVVPVRTATEAAEALSTALVAARRIDGLLRHDPEFGLPADPVPLPGGPLALTAGELHLPAARLSVLPPDRELALRMAGFAAGEVRVGGVPLDRVDRAELRRRVVLVLADDLWFSGPVGAELAAGRRVPLERAVHAADAVDVIDALPGGYAEVLSERGRSVSGGQRQRLLLARALTLDPDVLVLDEPTSAVDAHTEARIARRVAQLRAGRTTVVLTSSPLWRQVADGAVRVVSGYGPYRGNNHSRDWAAP